MKGESFRVCSHYYTPNRSLLSLKGDSHDFRVIVVTHKSDPWYPVTHNLETHQKSSISTAETHQMPNAKTHRLMHTNLNSHHTPSHIDLNPTVCPRRTLIPNPFIIAKREVRKESDGEVERKKERGLFICMRERAHACEIKTMRVGLK